MSLGARSSGPVVKCFELAAVKVSMVCRLC